MASFAAQLAKAVLPEEYLTRVRSVRSRNTQLRWLKKHGVLELARKFVEANGSSVLHGPFAGMKYPQESILSRHSVPLLLGSYERELHEIVAAALEKKYGRVVNIGSGDGYYAVGFASRGKSPVVAFEADHRERKLGQEMARLNCVADRLETRGLCSPKMLRDLTAGIPCLVLSDCEGYEIELFDLETIEALRLSQVLIELHDEAGRLLPERFEPTHRVEILTCSARSAEEYPELACLGTDADRAVAEYRIPQQQWLHAIPRAHTAQNR